MIDTALPDLHAYAYQSDPMPTLLQLQKDDPVHWSRHGYWYLTRYEDVKTVLSDPATFSSQAAGYGNTNSMGKGGGKGSEGDISKSFARSFNQQDPPDHTRIRQLVVSAFSRREIESRADYIQGVTDTLLTAARAKGTFDLVKDFAFHLPMIVALEIIGIPVDERDRFRWALAASASLMAPKRSQEEWDEAIKASRWLGGFVKAVIAERREAPQDDLISALIQVSEKDDRLTDAEISAAILTIFTAAGTTTERYVSSGAYLLLKHEDQLADLKANPALLDNALEEILRFHHPDQSTSTNRRATRDVELRGKLIREGDTVRVGLGAANRDPEIFPDPNRFDIRRQGARHLSFGYGAHFCIGSALARFEANCALKSLFLAGQGLALVTQEPRRDPARADRYEEILVRSEG